jgi:hypothetical protein
MLKSLMNLGQRSPDGGAVRFGIRVVVQAIPQCDDESGFRMPYGSYPGKWSCNRRFRLGQGRGNLVFAHQGVSAVGMDPDLGHDGIRPEPDDSVVRFLDQQWSIEGEAEFFGHPHCGTVTRRSCLEASLQRFRVHASSLTR